MNVYNAYNFEAEYVFKEYPKWVILADGTQIIVNNSEEEQVAVGEEKETSAVSEDSEREALVKEAQALGLEFHHKTGIKKLRELIAAAKA